MQVTQTDETFLGTPAGVAQAARGSALKAPRAPPVHGPAPCHGLPPRLLLSLLPFAVGRAWQPLAWPIDLIWELFNCALPRALYCEVGQVRAAVLRVRKGSIDSRR